MILGQTSFIVFRNDRCIRRSREANANASARMPRDSRGNWLTVNSRGEDERFGINQR